MRYIFYHIFKRLGWTKRKPIIVIHTEASYDEKEYAEIENAFKDQYDILMVWDSDKTDAKIIY